MNLIFGAVLLAVRLQGEVGGIGGGSILYLSISLRWPTRSQCDGVSLLHYGIFTIVNYYELLYFIYFILYIFFIILLTIIIFV